MNRPNIITKSGIKLIVDKDGDVLINYTDIDGTLDSIISNSEIDDIINLLKKAKDKKSRQN